MNFKSRIILLPFLVLLISAFDLSAQTWDFIKEQDGIKLYTRKEKGNILKSFKGVMEIASTMEKVSNILGNVRNHDWWDENLREIKVLKFDENKYFQYYLIYKVPWPFTDRDLCVEATISVDPANGKKTIAAVPLFNVVPEKEGLVRIKNYWQKWTILPMENGILRLTLEGFVDPAGNVPSWLYNMVIVDTPLKVMRRVKKFVQ